MIFSIGDHIAMIIHGEKTQTRRQSHRYNVGSLISIQPHRGHLGITVGKIRILRKWMEDEYYDFISKEDAKAEGGYTPEEYEKLYSRMYGTWNQRWAYEFEFVPNCTQEAKEQ